MNKRPIQIFSSGGGTQSAAITALIVQGKLPKPDLVCIVDTERERGATWIYLDMVIRPVLRSVGLEVHRIRKSEWGTKPAHGKDWRSHNDNTLLLPAWTTQTGDQVGKLSGFCSDKWKVRVRNRYVTKKLGIKKSRVCNWIGYSLDEKKRWSRMLVSKEYESGALRLPLVKDHPCTRQQSIDIVTKEMGWPMPPRSACWMCPNMDDGEWSSLPTHELQGAIAMDEAIRADDPFAFLHHSGKPLSEVKFTAPNKDGGDYCSSGGCFT